MLEPHSMPTDSRSSTTLYAYAALVTTSIHHAYGALRYDTPWRMHAAIVAILGAAAITIAARVYDAQPESSRGRFAGWTSIVLVIVLVGVGLGVFEGGYNHVLKNAFFLAGASTTTMTRLFPPPTYELPNDAVFELTGIAQAIPAWLAALSAIRFGGRLLRQPALPAALKPR